LRLAQPGVRPVDRIADRGRQTALSDHGPASRQCERVPASRTCQPRGSILPVADDRAVTKMRHHGKSVQFVRLQRYWNNARVILPERMITTREELSAPYQSRQHPIPSICLATSNRNKRAELRRALFPLRGAVFGEPTGEAPAEDGRSY